MEFMLGLLVGALAVFVVRAVMARVILGGDAGRPIPALVQLSTAAKAARAPLPPEDRVDARHDPVHRDHGRARAASTVRNKQRGPTEPTSTTIRK